MIMNVERRQGAQVEGTFRVHRPVRRVARNHATYQVCMLQDRTGKIPAYAWSDRYQGVSLEDKQLVAISGKMRWFGDRWYIDLSAAEQAGSADNPFRFLPDDYCPIQGCVSRLAAVVDQLKIRPLREFVLNVLRNDAIVVPLLAMPASRNHHHSYAGGLLEHSLECVEFVLRAAGQWGEQRELAACAALVHDVGKIRTLDRSSGRLLGALLGHDLLTLELLAHPLAQLDQEWRDGGIALRYLLSWKLQGRNGNRPLMTAAELVQAADRISSGLHNETALFRDTPAWRQLVSDEVGRKFWRPILLTAGARSV